MIRAPTKETRHVAGILFVYLRFVFVNGLNSGQ